MQHTDKEKDMLIKEEEHQDFVDSFWTMLRECETKAHNDNDAILKHWVDQWYNQYNRVTGSNVRPVWSGA